jgi:polysaccharide export outer membrane protein
MNNSKGLILRHYFKNHFYLNEQFMIFFRQVQMKTVINILFIAVLILASSCVSQRQIEYLQNEKSDNTNFPNDSFEDYVLKPNDEVYVQISSLDEASSAVFANGSASQNLGNLNPYGASLMSHTIDKDGYLELPVIGKVQAKDKTIAQLKVLIKEALVNILNQPVISVKLVNRYISILGEVKNPGHFAYSQEKLSIFDALGIAGDITDYGDRKNIILVRDEKNVNTKVEINLTKSDILKSQYYFLRPGDVIYVRPMRNKFWGMRQFPFAVFLTSISTTILVLNYVNNQ